ncbi:MAG: VTT domain-containing protein [Chloroflexi bacterium]|nr:VTT domain-containing protein [Chloroflexota bacterium]
MSEAQHYINLLSPYIYHYGYLVAFLGMMLENAGIPIPGETALIIVSFFAAQGVLKIWLAVPLVIIGDVIGDSIGYLIGRFGGRPLVEKYGRFIRLDKAKLDAAESLFREKGGRTVFASQFSSVTRTTGSIAAGLAHMPFRKFLAYDSAAAIVLVVLVSSVTFYFGKNVDATLRFFHMFRLVGLGSVATIVTAYLYRYYQRNKNLDRHLGVKLVTGVTVASLVIGLAYYSISGALIVLPRGGQDAGLTSGSAGGVEFKIERGFVSDIEGNNFLITALGQPKITFLAGQTRAVQVTMRNIDAHNTQVEGSALNRQPVALDDETLNFGVTTSQSAKTEIELAPKVSSERFDFAITSDTRDSGPIFSQLVDSVNRQNPAFVVNAGDFVKDGEKRKYRAFLSQASALRAPFYTSIGDHEVLDRGETAYSKLFGPRNYSFTYQGSTFIFLDTATRKADFGWLEGELKKAEGSKFVFLVTYAAPFDSEQFIDLVANSRVKTVYSVKVTGEYREEVKGVHCELLKHDPEAKYFYRLVHVNGDSVREDTIEITPRNLTAWDRISLAFEELKQEVAGYFSK